MRFISEEQSAALISHEMAFQAAREALIAAVESGSAVFPAVIAHGSQPQNRFTVKAGSTLELAGLKVGSFWPSNPGKGLPRHNSITLLFDQDIGRIEWVIESGTVNAFRTAAVDAVATDLLANPEAATIAIFGAGNQALYECQAIARIRPITRVLVVARDIAKGEQFAVNLAELGIAAELADAEQACRAADIVITATPSRTCLFEAEWIQPGTHISAMGSDAAGKQELPPSLFDRALLFCDLPAQSRTIGEYQHFDGDPARIKAVGDLLLGRAPGRIDADDITIFDSSGISLQDLYTARHLIAAFEKS